MISSVGHFARDCPTFTGVRRDAMVIFCLSNLMFSNESCLLKQPSGGGPIRRAGFPGRDYQGPAECYRCNKLVLITPISLSQKCTFILRMGHFARECPEYNGLPMSGVYRGQPPLPTSAPPYGRGNSRPPAPPGEYGTSKCLKCNK